MYFNNNIYSIYIQKKTDWELDIFGKEKKLALKYWKNH